MQALSAIKSGRRLILTGPSFKQEPATIRAAVAAVFPVKTCAKPVIMVAKRPSPQARQRRCALDPKLPAMRNNRDMKWILPRYVKQAVRITNQGRFNALKYNSRDVLALFTGKDQWGMNPYVRYGYMLAFIRLIPKLPHAERRMWMGKLPAIIRREPCFEIRKLLKQAQAMLKSFR